MGATNCPETPRQRMISMMYLVLTALLALNVSVEIINAFIIVNESVETTNTNFEKKIDGTYANFEKAYIGNPGKVKEFYDKAQKAKTYSNELVGYIKGLKYELISKTEEISIKEAQNLNIKEIKRKDNYDTPTNYFIGKEGSKNGKAYELRKKLDQYRKNMLDLIDEKYKPILDKSLGLKTNEGYKDKDGAKQDWEDHNFYRTITVAAITILNKTVADVLNTEFDIVNQLYSSVSADDFTFDQIGAKVVATSNYVLLGDQYQAEIFVAAFDTKSKISAEINGATVQGEKGMVLYKAGASSEGLKKYKGQINVSTPFGVKSYPFENEYIVAKPSATVSADKMNVFYIGVDNPVTVSVPGVANEKVKPRMTGGTITPKGAGKYNVKVDKLVSGAVAKAYIEIFADFDGKQKSMGKSEFRIKRVPDPVPTIGGVSEGFIEKNKLTSAGGIIAQLKDFDFELQMFVTSFTMQTIVKGDLSPKLMSRDNKFTKEMLALMGQANRGQKFWFENITVKAPEGSRRVSGINLTIR
ncbi:MAG: gliding motility protein GldM [Bacteroidetes bacterium]|nr:gliding motility protein GldM [Bacteroidota bacterium]